MGAAEFWTPNLASEDRPEHLWGLKMTVDSISLDWRVLLFTFGASMLTGIAFGLVPALHATAPNLGEGLKESERGSTEGVGRNRLRSVLIASESALCARTSRRCWVVGPQLRRSRQYRSRIRFTMC
jgi:hypothetical protein